MESATMRIIIATLLLHTALNGILPAAFAAAVDDAHRATIAEAWDKLKGLIP